MIRYYVAGWKDSPPFFPQKKLKKACILLHFCIIILFIEKTISYYLISPFKRSLTLQNGK